MENIKSNPETLENTELSEIFGGGVKMSLKKM